MSELVRLRIRPSRNGKKFVYLLDYKDENGKRRFQSLGHADESKAERQKKQKERELRMGVIAPESMNLKGFTADSLTRTGNQIRQSTKVGYESDMKKFIEIIGNKDYQAVKYRDGEKFIQKCIDAGDSPAAVAKRLRHVKRFFELAVKREQLEKHPFEKLTAPKVPKKKKIRTYKLDEIERMIKAAKEVQNNSVLQWDIFIAVALVTGMRKSELLNLVWSDIDFAEQNITVNPKSNTAETWEWLIKDTDSRKIGILEIVCNMLADLQSKSLEGYPYVFVPPVRYDHIQQRRKDGKWVYSDSRLKVINNFKSQFDKILRRAGIKNGRFHDIRSTAITNWFEQGINENDVMKLAGHSKFDTTHDYYLAWSDDLEHKTRIATEKNYNEILLRTCCAPPTESKKERSQHA